MPPNELPMIISLSRALNQKELRRRRTEKGKSQIPYLPKALSIFASL
jgi:hypothetical protein